MITLNVLFPLIFIELCGDHYKYFFFKNKETIAETVVKIFIWNHIGGTSGKEPVCQCRSHRR